MIVPLNVLYNYAFMAKDMIIVWGRWILDQISTFLRSDQQESFFLTIDQLADTLFVIMQVDISAILFAK